MVPGPDCREDGQMCYPMECIMQHAVMDWLNSQAAVWYEEGISKLMSRYGKCLIVQGDYVEK